MRDVEVTLFDSNGRELAKGIVYEYDEKKGERVVELRCRSDIGVYLDQRVNIKHESDYGPIWLSYGNHVPNQTEIDRGFALWLNQIWTEGLPGKELISPIELWSTCFKYLTWAVWWTYNDLSWGARNYYLRIDVNYEGSRYGLLKQFAQLFNVKFVYDDKKFSMIPFEQYSDAPVHVIGYASNEKWDAKQQEYIELTLINRIGIGDRAKSLSWVHLPNAFDMIRARLKDIVKYTSYDIWGFAVNEEEKIIYSGQTIELDYVKYYVQDIKYDKETLNGMKSFSATCVRFV